jgi:hypothetical protein
MHLQAKIAVDIDRRIAVAMLVAVTQTDSIAPAQPQQIGTIALPHLEIAVLTIEPVPNSGEIVRLTIATIEVGGKIDQIQKSPKKKLLTICTASIQFSPRSKTNAKSIGFGYSPNSATIQPFLP